MERDGPTFFRRPDGGDLNFAAAHPAVAGGEGDFAAVGPVRRAAREFDVAANGTRGAVRGLAGSDCNETILDAAEAAIGCFAARGDIDASTNEAVCRNDLNIAGAARAAAAGDGN